VLYKGRQVGLFVPDLIAFDTIVVDTKVIDRIADHRKGTDVELSADHKLACRSDPEF
jgi:hypothetical protein